MSNGTHWRFTFWLVFSSTGRVRQTVREPDTSRDERKMLVSVDLPKSLWSSPSLKATISVTEDDHEPKFVIDLQAAGDAMRKVLGVDVDMRIVPSEPIVAGDPDDLDAMLGVIQDAANKDT